MISKSEIENKGRFWRGFIHYSAITAVGIVIVLGLMMTFLS